MMLPRWLSAQWSIRRQLVVGVALVHAVLMSIFVIDLVLQQRTFFQTRHEQRTNGLVQGIARHATGELMSGDLIALQEIIDGFIDYPEMRYAAILDPDGKVLAHSQRTLVGRFMSDPITQAMLDGPRSTRTLVDDDHVLDVATPVVWEGRVLGWVRFAAGWDAISERLREVVREGLLYGLGAVMLGVLMAMVMARDTTRRLYGLLHVADATRAGRRDMRGEADSVNEVGRLAASFNAMLDTLSDKEAALERANHELEDRVAQRTTALAESEATQRAILEQANDAFVSIDATGRVVTWNRMAERIFGWGHDEAVGQELATLVIPPALRAAHNQGMARFLASGSSRLMDRRIEVAACRRDGSEFPVELSMRLRRCGSGALYFDAFLRDITDRKALQQQLEAQAQQDSLTGLPNRRALMQTLPLAMARAQRSGQSMAVLFLDLDGFKGVNDQHGHDAGDRVLKEFAGRLRDGMRAVDTVARLAGDEFVVVVEGLAQADDTLTVAAKVLQAAESPFDLGQGAVARLSSSIGMRLFTPDDTCAASDLLTQADDAMYEAKRCGKGCARLWQPGSAASAPASPAVAPVLQAADP